MRLTDTHFQRYLSESHYLQDGLDFITCVIEFDQISMLQGGFPSAIK